MSEKNLYNKISMILFGDFHTFEGDPYHWIMNWSTMFFRTRFQRILSTIACIIYMMVLYLCLNYIFFNYRNDMKLREHCATASFITNIVVSYTVLANMNERCRNGLKFLINIYSHGKPPSKALVAKKQVFSKSIKKILYGYWFMVVFVLVGFILFANRDTNLVFLICPQIILDSIILRFLFFGVVGLHSFLHISVPLCLSYYFIIHISFNLEILNEQIEELLRFEDECNDPNILNYINCALYQEIITKNLKYFSAQFNKIKQMCEIYNEETKWTLAGIHFAGALLISCTFTFIVEERTNPEIIPFIAIFTTAFLFYITLSDIGEKMEMMSENVYENLVMLNWYHYDKFNSNLYLVLLLQVKKPFTTNCYGFIVQNKTLVLKIYRVLHSYVAYSFSTGNDATRIH